MIDGAFSFTLYLSYSHSLSLLSISKYIYTPMIMIGFIAVIILFLHENRRTEDKKFQNSSAYTANEEHDSLMKVRGIPPKYWENSTGIFPLYFINSRSIPIFRLRPTSGIFPANSHNSSPKIFFTYRPFSGTAICI